MLASPATSASTERFFSAGGRVCAFDRASLTLANVDILTSIHVWEKSELEEDNRTKQRVAANEKFCRIKKTDFNKIVIIHTIEFDDDDEFEDDIE